MRLTLLDCAVYDSFQVHVGREGNSASGPRPCKWVRREEESSPVGAHPIAQASVSSKTPNSIEMRLQGLCRSGSSLGDGWAAIAQ